jgi:protein phosphatase 2C family protein 2/3
MCYVANVGDSRAVLSWYFFDINIRYSEEGNRIYPLSRDHKPCDELEKRRIIEAGG